MKNYFSKSFAHDSPLHLHTAKLISASSRSNNHLTRCEQDLNLQKV